MLEQRNFDLIRYLLDGHVDINSKDFKPYFSLMISLLEKSYSEKEKPDTAKMITSPMPGLIVSVEVSVGQEVKNGEALVTVEAMKMENVLRAELDGVVKSITCEPGSSVAADELLIEFE